jgi:hypothetical protein
MVMCLALMMMLLTHINRPFNPPSSSWRDACSKIAGWNSRIWYSTIAREVAALGNTQYDIANLRIMPSNTVVPVLVRGSKVYILKFQGGDPYAYYHEWLMGMLATLSLASYHK